MPRRVTDLFAPKTRAAKSVPFAFVLEQLERVEPTTRAMFGSTAVYLGERIVFVLREKGDVDDGVWIAYETTRESEALAALPRLVAIERLPNVRCWRKLAKASPHFEEDVLAACRLAAEEGSPIGKLPARMMKKLSAPKTRTARQARAPSAATKRAPKSVSKRAASEPLARAPASALPHPSKQPKAAPTPATKRRR
jgi:hypothetical protein